VTPPQTPPGAAGSDPGPGLLPAKTALRDQVLAARRRRSLAELSQAALALCEQALACAEVRRAVTVAAYVSVGSEPGTGPLLEALLARHRRVLLPVLRPDLDLDWAEHRGTSALAPAHRGLLEPTAPLLGPEAVATADVVLVPGLAVGPAGDRLGRGGGSYDRALARVPVGTFTAVLLHEGETGLAVPTEPHDRPVTAAVTPGGVLRFG
jgi:5-formyltetrahydrofolate cyclo-ligase